MKKRTPYINIVTTLIFCEKHHQKSIGPASRGTEDEKGK